MMEGLLRLAPGQWILAVYVIKLVVIAGGLRALFIPSCFKNGGGFWQGRFCLAVACCWAAPMSRLFPMWGGTARFFWAFCYGGCSVLMMGGCGF